jgi:hypothetical protein
MSNCQKLSYSTPPPSATFMWTSQKHYTNLYRKMPSYNLLDFSNKSVPKQWKFWLAKFTMNFTAHWDIRVNYVTSRAENRCQCWYTALHLSLKHTLFKNAIPPVLAITPGLLKSDENHNENLYAHHNNAIMSVGLYTNLKHVPICELVAVYSRTTLLPMLAVYSENT